MFCYDVTLVIASVKVTGQVCYLKSAFFEIFKAVVKEQVAVGFEVNLSAFCEYLFVLVELCGVGKPALVVFEAGPGVTEVYVDSGDAVFTAYNLGDFVYIVRGESDVFTFSVVFSVELYNVASAYCQHIADKVNGKKVGIGVLQSFVSNEVTFAAAYLKFNGITAFKKIFPSSSVVAGGFYEEIAGIEFGLCPFLFTHSHIITEKTQYFDYIYY